jgi:serine/threonine protein kinase
LRQCIERGNEFSNYELQNTYFQLLYGLFGLHSSKIMHRDVKPENILLTTYENTKTWSLPILYPDEQLNYTLPSECLKSMYADFGLSDTKVHHTGYAWNNGTLSWSCPFGWFYLELDLEKTQKAPTFGFDTDTWSLGLVFWFLAATGLKIESGKKKFSYTSLTRFFAGDIPNTKPEPYKKVVEKCFKELKAAIPNKSWLADSGILLALNTCILKCAIMESFGHPFLPPQKITNWDGKQNEKQFQWGPIAKVIKKYENEIKTAIFSFYGFDIFYETSQKIKEKLPNELVSVIFSMLSWDPRDRNAGRVIYDGGAFVLDLCKKIYVDGTQSTPPSKSFWINGNLRVSESEILENSASNSEYQSKITDSSQTLGSDAGYQSKISDTDQALSPSFIQSSIVSAREEQAEIDILANVVEEELKNENKKRSPPITPTKIVHFEDETMAGKRRRKEDEENEESNGELQRTIIVEDNDVVDFAEFGPLVPNIDFGPDPFFNFYQ